MAIKPPQTHHRNRPILKTFNLRPYKKPEERICPICKLEVEDQYPFFTVCPTYQEKRNVLFNNLKNEHLERGKAYRQTFETAVPRSFWPEQ